jgi:hypothetical protein
MSDSIEYTPSRLLDGPAEAIRQHSFTRWMSADLMQAATDFCRNISLCAIYTECSPEKGYRKLLWHPPENAFIEVRSGRTRDQFTVIDHRNAEAGRKLLSLHIDEADNYSAVWISADHYETAQAVLAVYGITPAERNRAA